MHSQSNSGISKLAILGPGLLGGSVAMAARERGLAGRISIWGRRAEAVKEIESMQIADEVSTDLGVIADRADFVVVATPVRAVAPVVASFLEAAPSSRAVLTDVGSVKASVVSEVHQRVADREVRFVGSHPMAGAEKAGVTAARSDLFQNAACILTPDGNATDPAALQRVREFWESLGCRTFEMPPGQHDSLVAAISHVPHVVAAAVVRAALGGDDELRAGRLIGNGFRDTTRVASGSPELWKEILLENRDSVITSLEHLRENLSEVLEFLHNLDEEKLLNFLDEAKRLRDACLEN